MNSLLMIGKPAIVALEITKRKYFYLMLNSCFKLSYHTGRGLILSSGLEALCPAVTLTASRI